MTTKIDPYIISMCPEHPQNLKWDSSQLSSPLIQHAERLGWKSLNYCGNVFGREIENTILELPFVPKVTEVHIPTNICASSDGLTSWECYRLLLEVHSDTMVCVDYRNKTMNINELDAYQILRGPHGKVNKFLIYGNYQDSPTHSTLHGSYWDFISPSKHDDYGYFKTNHEAMNFAVQLLAIDKAKIEMEMLKVQLKLI